MPDNTALLRDLQTVVRKHYPDFGNETVQIGGLEEMLIKLADELHAGRIASAKSLIDQIIGGIQRRPS